MLLAATAAAPAFADSSSDQRSGLVLGASVDGGNIGCQTKNGDDCGNGAHPAGGFSVHAGAMLMPRIALIGEMWGMAHTQDSLTATQVLGTVNLRGWVLPRLWLQGGVGVARSKLSFDSGGGLMASATSSTVPAVNAAIGFELLQSSKFGLDVELRAGSGLYEEDVRIYNAALGVGVTFF
ncbi:MAG TPA: hypothetical protein VHN14_17030 [Kofleriaceae bacterium]|jgi:hypothetical protein|nr:hypothetical protein [Kofleriaceae bacterium]